MKRRILRLLDRAGLVGPAFRVYERVVSLRPGRSAAVEGPALPPRRLMVRVAGTADAEWFLRSGRAAYDAIAAHVPLDSLESVLDFGCGCGRVTRYWSDFGGSVSGSDVNAKAIDWCRDNLDFASFERNTLAPPLDFDPESFDFAYALSVFTHLTAELQLAWRDNLGFASFERNTLTPPLDFDAESFDLVYALSVFTHLTAELQLAWRDEMLRVLRPGGLLLLTTHGRSYVPRLDADERARFERGELVVRWGDVPGTNLCSAYHPEVYLHDTFAQGFTFLELEPEGARGNPTQDLVLLRKD